MRFVKLCCKLWYDKKDWEEAICGKICLCPAKIDSGPENHLFEKGNDLNQTFIFVFHVDFQGYIIFFSFFLMGDFLNAGVHHPQNQQRVYTGK